MSSLPLITLGNFFNTRIKRTKFYLNSQIKDNLCIHDSPSKDFLQKWQKTFIKIENKFFNRHNIFYSWFDFILLYVLGTGVISLSVTIIKPYIGSLEKCMSTGRYRCPRCRYPSWLVSKFFKCVFLLLCSHFWLCLLYHIIDKCIVNVTYTITFIGSLLNFICPPICILYTFMMQ